MWPGAHTTFYVVLHWLISVLIRKCNGCRYTCMHITSMYKKGKVLSVKMFCHPFFGRSSQVNSPLNFHVPSLKPPLGTTSKYSSTHPSPRFESTSVSGISSLLVRVHIDPSSTNDLSLLHTLNGRSPKTKRDISSSVPTKGSYSLTYVLEKSLLILKPLLLFQ